MFVTGGDTALQQEVICDRNLVPAANPFAKYGGEKQFKLLFNLPNLFNFVLGVYQVLRDKDFVKYSFSHCKCKVSCILMLVHYKTIVQLFTLSLLYISQSVLGNNQYTPIKYLHAMAVCRKHRYHQK